jgi:SAM-dependent methyltransferase
MASMGTTEAAGRRYDKHYFDHWYRRQGFGSRARLARKVEYAVSAAEYLLERPIRNVLDVGCGEGSWSKAIGDRRPKATYLGVDPSEYAVARYGARRNLRLGGLADLGGMGLAEHAPFDLVVCVDVIAYAPADDVRAGLRSIATLLGGVALVEVFTAVDEFEGDTVGYHARSPSVYRRWFAEVGLARIGPHLYAGARLLPDLVTFEVG